jgi:2-hydroxy-4-carboxymuconate semialdehyde hemiacetal dehydrogenase
MNGIEFEDHEFFAAIAERREPRSSMADTLPALATLARLEEQLGRFVAP